MPPIPAVFSLIGASVHRRASFATMERDQARSPRLDGVSTGRPFGFRGHPNISVRGSRLRCAAPRERFQTRQIPVDQRQLLDVGPALELAFARNRTLLAVLTLLIQQLDGPTACGPRSAPPL
jgi:hypothetical protein